MDSNRANIDLLFRNGLRDLEVLPPADAWSSILPVIRKKQRPVVLLRSAATIAVLLSISFLAYKWSQQLNIPGQIPYTAFEQESERSLQSITGGSPARFGLSSDRQAGSNGIYQDETQVNEAASENTAENITDDEADLTSAGSINLSGSVVIPGNISSLMGQRDVTFNRDFSYEQGYDISSEDQAPKPDKWSITAMASPTYYLRPDMSAGESSSQMSSLEQSRISYSGGVGVAYKINKKLSIQSGLYFSSVGNTVDNIRSFAGFTQFDFTKGDHNFEVLTSSGRIYTSNPDVFLEDNAGNRVVTRYTNDVFDPTKANLPYINNSLFQNFSYLEMPVMVRYKILDKGLDFNLIGGLSYNLLVSNSVHTVIDGNRYKIGKTADLNSFMVSSSLGMGMEYSFSEKFSLNLEPTFRYYLNPFSNGQGTRFNPYSFGVFSGLSYKF